MVCIVVLIKARICPSLIPRLSLKGSRAGTIYPRFWKRVNSVYQLRALEFALKYEQKKAILRRESVKIFIISSGTRDIIPK